MLSKEAIAEYKALYKKRYNVDLTDAEAFFRASNLVRLYEIIYDSHNGSHDNKKSETLQ